MVIMSAKFDDDAHIMVKFLLCSKGQGMMNGKWTDKTNTASLFPLPYAFHRNYYVLKVFINKLKIHYMEKLMFKECLHT